eukprot:s183_g6.t1
MSASQPIPPWASRLSAHAPLMAVPRPLPLRMQFPDHPVMVLVDFSPVHQLSFRHNYFSVLNRRWYDHLNGFDETAMWQLSKHQTNVYRVLYLLEDTIRRVHSQWQIELTRFDLRIHYETADGYDVVLDINDSIPGVLQSNRPDWRRRQYDAFSSMGHPNQLDKILDEIVERIEQQWQVVLHAEDLEIRYDEPDGLEVFQVTFIVHQYGDAFDLQVQEINMVRGSNRESRVEYFFHRLVGDWNQAQRLGNYWRDHYNVPTLPVDPVEVDPPSSIPAAFTSAPADLTLLPWILQRCMWHSC